MHHERTNERIKELQRQLAATQRALQDARDMQRKSRDMEATWAYIEQEHTLENALDGLTAELDVALIELYRQQNENDKRG